MAKFERVARFADDETIHLPVRKTANAAGYDFEAAEDIIVPAKSKLITLLNRLTHGHLLSLEQIGKLTKDNGLRPTLVPTGIKCQLAPNQVLEITVRSSTPYKYWLVLANGTGIIDADYYGCENTDGEIYFQLINETASDIAIHKGDVIGQGIIHTFDIVDEDNSSGVRTGGLGSTDENIST